MLNPQMFLRVIVSLAILTCALCGPARASSLPRLEADSIGGTHVVLPTDASGKRLVLLLAFTRESESDLKQWSHRLLADGLNPNSAVYVVVVADKLAFVSRRHIRDLVSGTGVGTKDQIDNNVLITFNGTGWRGLVPPGDKKTVGIVVCDAGGTIVLAKRQPYNDADLKEVEAFLK